jgi:hypothetical protein
LGFDVDLAMDCLKYPSQDGKSSGRTQPLYLILKVLKSRLASLQV